MKLREILLNQRTPLALGVDDAPSVPTSPARVPLCAVVCRATVFEGMLWGRIERDGDDVTKTLIKLITSSKFKQQLHVILTDGVTFGGFNILNLPELAAACDLPVIAIMRRQPNLKGMHQAIESLPNPIQRHQNLTAAGPIHTTEHLHFQVHGTSPDTAKLCINRLTNRGYIPEPLRIAHLIGAAVQTGSSGRRA